MPKPRKKRGLRPLPRVETAWTVDPLSDLVSGEELRIWRSHLTTKKVLRYLGRWRGALLEQLGEGASLEPSAEASAMRTTEFVAKNQLLKDLLTLEPKDIAEFYGLKEPNEATPKEK